MSLLFKALRELDLANVNSVPAIDRKTSQNNKGAPLKKLILIGIVIAASVVILWSIVFFVDVKDNKIKSAHPPIKETIVSSNYTIEYMSDKDPVYSNTPKDVINPPPNKTTFESESSNVEKKENKAGGVEANIQVNAIDINQLTEHLVDAIRNEDENQVNEYLDKLKDANLDESFSVKRIEASWLLRIGEYGQARILLQQVLNQYPDDLEASLNMAMLEINENDVNAARKILYRLFRLYPNDARAEKLLGSLR